METDNNITKVCGFKDSSGHYWDTFEEAERANQRIKKRELEESILTKIEVLFGENYHNTARGYYLYSAQFRDLIINHPEKVLAILWEVTRFNFNKKFKE